MNKLVLVSRKYIGQTEKPGNSGFTDAEFEKRMKACGWAKGQAWCAYFCELVCREAYQGKDEELKLLFSPSAVITYENFKNAGRVSDTPTPGSLAVWRYGKTWQGHIGVVTEILSENFFKTIEGNTNAIGGREGYIVAEKTRKLKQPYSAKGLNLIGFINP